MDVSYRTMKSTKVQTLRAVALHVTAACTDEASIVGFWSTSLGYSHEVVILPVLHVSCIYINKSNIHVDGRYVHTITFATHMYRKITTWTLRK